MAPPALQNLYTRPTDVFDYIGAEGVQLRLDDRNQATGQTIQVTADAAVLATTLFVTALAYPLIKGSSLQFDGGGMPFQGEAILAATATTGTTALSVQPLAAAIPANAIAFDNGNNLVMANRLAKGCSYGTAQVKLYCCNRYNDSDLVNSWSVNRWATVIAGRWVAKRLCRSCPEGIDEDFEETLNELKAVRIGNLCIEDIGTRTSGWPFLSNVTVNPAYDYAKIRVEPSLSEQTPTQYGQYIDWNSVLYVEW